MPSGGADLHVLKPRLQHPLLHGIGAAGHIGLVLRVGTDARNAQKVKQFVQETLFVGLDKGV